jgi:Stage II sporulation protein R (spore_II_R).
MRGKYPEGASMDEAVAYVRNNLSEIRKVAEGVVRKSGSDMKVSVRFGEFPFPTKAYEDITLPAGMYRSVRIELGEARGKNWWCVMFPPLCIADDNTMRMSPESREQLKATIGEEGYRLVTDVGDGDDTEIKVKFKIVELVQSSRLKLAELISRLF